MRSPMKSVVATLSLGAGQQAQKARTASAEAIQYEFALPGLIELRKP